jgi:hypothetical protein
LRTTDIEKTGLAVTEPFAVLMLKFGGPYYFVT